VSNGHAAEEGAGDEAEAAAGDAAEAAAAAEVGVAGGGAGGKRQTARLKELCSMTISSFWDPAGNIMHGNMHCDASGIKPVSNRHGPSGQKPYQMSTKLHAVRANTAKLLYPLSHWKSAHADL